MFKNASVCLVVHLSVLMNVCPSVRLSICPPIGLSVCLYVRVSSCLFVRSIKALEHRPTPCIYKGSLASVLLLPLLLLPLLLLPLGFRFHFFVLSFFSPRPKFVAALDQPLMLPLPLLLLQLLLPTKSPTLRFFFSRNWKNRLWLIFTRNLG